MATKLAGATRDNHGDVDSGVGVANLAISFSIVISQIDHRNDFEVLTLYHLLWRSW